MHNSIIKSGLETSTALGTNDKGPINMSSMREGTTGEAQTMEGINELLSRGTEPEYTIYTHPENATPIGNGNDYKTSSPNPSMGTEDGDINAAKEISEMHASINQCGMQDIVIGPQYSPGVNSQPPTVETTKISFYTKDNITPVYPQAKIVANTSMQPNASIKFKSFIDAV